MQILLTNDDGIHSLGLKALAESLTQLGDVLVVAPTTEQSGVSHAITFRTPLFAQEYTWDNGMKIWGVHGTPADCARLGVLNLSEKKPDLVVSGMNQGLNLGVNVIYSGTLAGAEEAAMLGINSIAVSLEYSNNPPWDAASEIATKLIKRIFELKTNPSVELYNINIPQGACVLDQPLKVCVAPMDLTPNHESYELREDPYGGPYYWFSGRTVPQDPNALTDRTAFQKGFVTVTPLDYNRTKLKEMEAMRHWLTDNSPHHEEQLVFEADSGNASFVDGT